MPEEIPESSNIIPIWILILIIVRILNLYCTFRNTKKVHIYIKGQSTIWTKNLKGSHSPYGLPIHPQTRSPCEEQSDTQYFTGMLKQGGKHLNHQNFPSRPTSFPTLSQASDIVFWNRTADLMPSKINATLSRLLLTAGLEVELFWKHIDKIESSGMQYQELTGPLLPDWMCWLWICFISRYWAFALAVTLGGLQHRRDYTLL